jgi:hypothetical protein
VPGCSRHGPHYVPCHGDGGRHGPPPPLGPEGRGPRRDDGGGADGYGGADGRGRVAARAVEGVDNPSVEVDPGWMP